MRSEIFGTLVATTIMTALCFPAAVAVAHSSLNPENRTELERLLAVRAGKTATSCTVLLPPRDAFSTLDRYLLWNEIALDTTAIDHTPNQQDPQCFGEQLGPHRSSRAMAIVHIAMFDAVNAISQKYAC